MNPPRRFLQFVRKRHSRAELFLTARTMVVTIDDMSRGLLYNTENMSDFHRAMLEFKDLVTISSDAGNWADLIDLETIMDDMKDALNDAEAKAHAHLNETTEARKIFREVEGHRWQRLHSRFN